MINKEDAKYKKYKKRVKIAKILTIVSCIVLLVIDALLSNLINGYNGGLFLIFLLGTSMYFFIPQYTSWKYEPTDGRKKNCNLLMMIIALTVIAFVGNIVLHIARNG